MSDSPYYCFFPGDYLRDTIHLGWFEDLAYRRLLDRYFMSRCPIPNDRALIMRLVRASEPEQQTAVDNVLLEFFKLEKDGWHQKKADLELQYLQNKRTQAKNAAKTRWSKNQQLTECVSNADAYADAMPPHPHPHPTHTQPNHGGNLTTEVITKDLVFLKPEVEFNPPEIFNHGLVEEKKTNEKKNAIVGTEPAPTKKRGTRLREDWKLPKSWGEWALQECPSLTVPTVRKMGETFRDYWISKSGASATKLNWEATWRNWVRKDAPQGGSRYGPKNPADLNAANREAMQRAKQKIFGDNETEKDITDDSERL